MLVSLNKWINEWLTVTELKIVGQTQAEWIQNKNNETMELTENHVLKR